MREVREETGLEVAVGPIVGTFGGPDCRHIYANGDEASYVMTTWLCDVVGGAEQVDGDEVADLRWVTRDEALTLPSCAWFAEVATAAFDGNAARRR